MMPGRFFLGVGTGENLNEHILGQGWPEIEVRQEKLAEAIQVIRMLWQEGQHSHRGKHFMLENARIYSRPDEPPPIMVAAAGPKSVELAGRFGGGLIATEPDHELARKFREGKGKNKSCFRELHVCFDRDERKAQKLAHKVWPVARIARPTVFRVAGALSVRKDSEARHCRPDCSRYSLRSRS